MADIKMLAAAGSEEAKAKVEQSRANVEQKLMKANEKAQALQAAGAAASGELKEGFDKAADDLKQAVAAARTQLVK